MADLYDARHKGLLDAIDRLNEQKDRLTMERDQARSEVLRLRSLLGGRVALREKEAR